MVAMEMVHDGDAKRADPERTKAIVSEARERGLLLLSCGVRSNVIRFLSPLTIPFDQLDEGLQVLGEVLSATKP